METTQAMSPYLHSAITAPSQKRRKTLAEKRLEMARIAEETLSRSRSRSVSYSREQHSDFTQEDSVDIDHPVSLLVWLRKNTRALDGLELEDN